MSEPTPPPERPLPDDARARIRADLLGHAQDDRASGPRWLVPVAAAAAVALVAGTAYWAISLGGSDAHQGVPVTGGGTSAASVTPDQPDASSVPTNTAGSASTVCPARCLPTTSEEPVEAGAGSCETELENVLKGADKAYVFPPGADAGTSAIYVKGEKFSLCDSREGTTTVTHPLPLKPQEDVATYRVLSIFPPTSDGYQTIRVAGGIVPSGLEGVFDVSYTFPDGHTQQATTSTDDQGRAWWLMVYRYDDGGGNEMQKPPIEVTVSYSGVQKHYSLAWATDTCAQANHGC
jgi:hypothetical protein